MTTENNVHEVAAELAIRRVIHRFARGLDRLDWDLIRSCCEPDATLVYREPYELEAWIAQAAPRLEQFLFSHHQLGNLLIEVEGSLARSESYLVARHRVPPSAGRPVAEDWVVGGRYVDRFAERDGDWRLTRRQIVVDWSAVEPVREPWAQLETYTKGRRSREDVSYAS